MRYPAAPCGYGEADRVKTQQHLLPHGHVHRGSTHRNDHEHLGDDMVEHSWGCVLYLGEVGGPRCSILKPIGALNFVVAVSCCTHQILADKTQQSHQSGMSGLVGVKLFRGQTYPATVVPERPTGGHIRSGRLLHEFEAIAIASRTKASGTLQNTPSSHTTT